MLSPRIQSSNSKKVMWQLFKQKSAYNSVNHVSDVHANQCATVQGGSAWGGQGYKA